MLRAELARAAAPPLGPALRDALAAHIAMLDEVSDRVTLNDVSRTEARRAYRRRGTVAMCDEV